MKKRINWRLFLITLAVIVLLSVALRYLSGLNYWACFAIVIGAIAINGFVAGVEDESPGGFNSPRK